MVTQSLETKQPETEISHAWSEQGEYALHGQFGLADTLTSKVLAGLELPVTSLFAAENKYST